MKNINQLREEKLKQKKLLQEKALTAYNILNIAEGVEFFDNEESGVYNIISEPKDEVEALIRGACDELREKLADLCNDIGRKIKILKNK